tara:strand:- start:97 stop:285 length:189 start_codon:yes stop_codon:yes gene_type:complete
MIGKTEITSAKYVKDSVLEEVTCIRIIVDKEQIIVPLAEDNAQYQEIMRQVDAGELTIEEAD